MIRGSHVKPLQLTARVWHTVHIYTHRGHTGVTEITERERVLLASGDELFNQSITSLYSTVQSERIRGALR